MDKEISVYDNTISARTYISYIAEQAGGFASIGRDGKLYIKTIGENTIELKAKNFQNFTWGEKTKISRIKYEDGIQLFESGDTTYNTIYINQDNMYIVEQEQIENIYNLYKNLEIYSFEGESIIDPAIDVGDILEIDNKKIIYQGSIQYGGKFKANISSKIQCKAKEETTRRVPSQKTINKKVQSQIDQEKEKITQLIQETSEHEEKITQHEQTIDSITSTVLNKDEINEQINELKQMIDGTINNLTITGGNNIFYYNLDYWEAEENKNLGIDEYSDTNTKQNTTSRLSYITKNGSAEQKQIVKNGTYTISFLYEKLIELATGYIEINGTKYILDAENTNEWKEEVHTIEVTSNTIDIKIETDTDNSFLIADLMVANGIDKVVWSQNPNETITDKVTIGKGIQVESSTSNIYTRIDADGNRTFNNTSKERVAEMTDKGVYAKELEVKNEAKINSLFIQKVGDQVWLTGIGG